MTDQHKRSLLKVAALSALASAALMGCGKKEEPAPAPAAPAPAPVAAAPAAPEPLKVAFAYVGPVGDGGWTFAHDNGRKAVEKEFGDMLFSLVNAARLYKIDPDAALERTNLKFIKRFNYLEEQTLVKGRSLHDMSLAEMDLIWEEAKKFDK